MKTTLIAFFLLTAFAHDFHLSLSEINYNEQNKSLEISIKLFTDDLMLGLEQSGAPKMEVGTENEPPRANEYIENYLKTHLKIKVNGKPAAYTYLGKEAEAEATWCFVEVPKVRKVKTMEVENTFLLQTFDDQINMVNLNINGRKASGLSRRGKTVLSFRF